MSISKSPDASISSSESDSSLATGLSSEYQGYAILSCRKSYKYIYLLNLNNYV
jgi:hypothetical protein